MFSADYKRFSAFKNRTNLPILPPKIAPLFKPYTTQNHNFQMLSQETSPPSCLPQVRPFILPPNIPPSKEKIQCSTVHLSTALLSQAKGLFRPTAATATKSNSIFARSFGLVQGVICPPHGGVLLYIEDVQSGNNNEVITRKNRKKLLTFVWNCVKIPACLPVGGDK